MASESDKEGDICGFDMSEWMLLDEDTGTEEEKAVLNKDKSNRNLNLNTNNKETCKAKLDKPENSLITQSTSSTSSVSKVPTSSLVKKENVRITLMVRPRRPTTESDGNASSKNVPTTKTSLNSHTNPHQCTVFSTSKTTKPKTSISTTSKEINDLTSSESPATSVAFSKNTTTVKKSTSTSNQKSCTKPTALSDLKSTPTDAATTPKEIAAVVSKHSTTNTSKIVADITPKVVTESTPTVDTFATTKVVTATTLKLVTANTKKAVTNNTSKVITENTPQVVTATTPKVDTATTSKVDTATTPKVVMATTQKIVTATTSKVDTATTPKVVMATTPKVAIATTSKVDTATIPKVDTATTSKVDTATTSKVVMATKPKVFIATTSKVDTANTSDVLTATTPKVVSVTSSKSNNAPLSKLPATTMSKANTSTIPKECVISTPVVNSITQKINTNSQPKGSNSSTKKANTASVPKTNAASVPKSNTATPPKANTVAVSKVNKATPQSNTATTSITSTASTPIANTVSASKTNSSTAQKASTNKTITTGALEATTTITTGVQKATTTSTCVKNTTAAPKTNTVTTPKANTTPTQKINAAPKSNTSATLKINMVAPATPKTNTPTTSKANNSATVNTNTITTPVKNATVRPKANTATTPKTSTATTPKTNTTAAPKSTTSATLKTNTTTTHVKNITVTPKTNTAATPKTNTATTPKTNSDALLKSNTSSTPKTNTTTTPVKNTTVTPKTNRPTTSKANNPATLKTNATTTPVENITATQRANTAETPKTNMAKASKTNTVMTPKANIATTPKTNAVTTPIKSLHSSQKMNADISKKSTASTTQSNSTNSKKNTPNSTSKEDSTPKVGVYAGKADPITTTKITPAKQLANQGTGGSSFTKSASKTSVSSNYSETGSDLLDSIAGAMGNETNISPKPIKTAKSNKTNTKSKDKTLPQKRQISDHTNEPSAKKSKLDTTKPDTPSSKAKASTPVSTEGVSKKALQNSSHRSTQTPSMQHINKLLQCTIKIPGLDDLKKKTFNQSIQAFGSKNNETEIDIDTESLPDPISLQNFKAVSSFSVQKISSRIFGARSFAHAICFGPLLPSDVTKTSFRDYVLKKAACHSLFCLDAGAQYVIELLFNELEDMKSALSALRKYRVGPRHLVVTICQTINHECYKACIIFDQNFWATSFTSWVNVLKWNKPKVQDVITIQNIPEGIPLSFLETIFPEVLSMDVDGDHGLTSTLKDRPVYFGMSKKSVTVKFLPSIYSAFIGNQKLTIKHGQIEVHSSSKKESKPINNRAQIIARELVAKPREINKDKHVKKKPKPQILMKVYDENGDQSEKVEKQLAATKKPVAKKKVEPYSKTASVTAKKSSSRFIFKQRAVQRAEKIKRYQDLRKNREEISRNINRINRDGIRREDTGKRSRSAQHREVYKRSADRSVGDYTKELASSEVYKRSADRSVRDYTREELAPSEVYKRSADRSVRDYTREELAPREKYKRSVDRSVHDYNREEPTSRFGTDRQDTYPVQAEQYERISADGDLFDEQAPSQKLVYDRISTDRDIFNRPVAKKFRAEHNIKNFNSALEIDQSENARIRRELMKFKQEVATSKMDLENVSPERKIVEYNRTTDNLNREYISPEIKRSEYNRATDKQSSHFASSRDVHSRLGAPISSYMSEIDTTQPRITQLSYNLIDKSEKPYVRKRARRARKRKRMRQKLLAASSSNSSLTDFCYTLGQDNSQRQNVYDTRPFVYEESNLKPVEPFEKNYVDTFSQDKFRHRGDPRRHETRNVDIDVSVNKTKPHERTNQFVPYWLNEFDREKGSTTEMRSEEERRQYGMSRRQDTSVFFDERIGNRLGSPVRQQDKTLERRTPQKRSPLSRPEFPSARERPDVRKSSLSPCRQVIRRSPSPLATKRDPVAPSPSKPKDSSDRSCWLPTFDDVVKQSDVDRTLQEEEEEDIENLKNILNEVLTKDVYELMANDPDKFVEQYKNSCGKPSERFFKDKTASLSDKTRDQTQRLDSSHKNVDIHDSSHRSTDRYDSSHRSTDRYDSSHRSTDRHDPSHRGIDKPEISQGSTKNFDKSHTNTNRPDSSHRNADLPRCAYASRQNNTTSSTQPPPFIKQSDLQPPIPPPLAPPFFNSSESRETLESMQAKARQLAQETNKKPVQQNPWPAPQVPINMPNVSLAGPQMFPRFGPPVPGQEFHPMPPVPFTRPPVQMNPFGFQNPNPACPFAQPPVQNNTYFF